MYSCADTSSIVLGRLPRELSVVIKNQRKTYIYYFSTHGCKDGSTAYLAVLLLEAAFAAKKLDAMVDGKRAKCHERVTGYVWSRRVVIPTNRFYTAQKRFAFPFNTIPNPLNR